MVRGLHQSAVASLRLRSTIGPIARSSACSPRLLCRRLFHKRRSPAQQALLSARIIVLSTGVGLPALPPVPLATGTVAIASTVRMVSCTRRRGVHGCLYRTWHLQRLRVWRYELVARSSWCTADASGSNAQYVTGLAFIRSCRSALCAATRS